MKLIDRLKIRPLYAAPTGDPSHKEKLDSVRTKLANERTLLAYFRTALTLFVAGVTFIRFFDSLIVEIIGWVFIPAGIINLILGIIRYRATRDYVSVMNDLEEP